MRFFVWLLIIVSILWIIACFVSMAIMSRGVDYSTEAILPSGAGLLAMVVGIWMISRKTKLIDDSSSSGDGKI